MSKNNIRENRIRRQLTMKELADRCGISIGYLCHLEKGTRDNPSKEVMENIAIVLGKSVQEIFFSNWVI